MDGDPELIFPSTTKLSDCLRQRWHAFSPGRFHSVSYRPLCSIILPSFDSSPSSYGSLIVYVKKKNHPFTQHPLSSVPSLISSKGDAYLTKRPTLPSAN